MEGEDGERQQSTSMVMLVLFESATISGVGSAWREMDMIALLAEVQSRKSIRDVRAAMRCIGWSIRRGGTWLVAVSTRDPGMRGRGGLAL